MAAWLGRWLKFAAFWGWQHESNTQPPCAFYLVRCTFAMGQIVEGCEMNNVAQKSECPVAAGHYTNQSTNDLDYPQSERQSKAESNLCAVLALAGHSVHPLRDGAYLVAKWGYTYCAGDITDLHAFAVRLGVTHG